MTAPSDEGPAVAVEDPVADEPIPAGSGAAVASQRRLVWRRFKRHKLAVVGLVVTILLYLVAAFCEFLAPHGRDTYRATNAYAPPQMVHISFTSSPHIYAYGLKTTVNKETFSREFTTDKSKKIPLRFFATGDKYKLWGLIPSSIHLFGPSHKGDRFYLFGADQQGRDLLSRMIYAARISLLVGLIGVSFSLVLGIVFGGLSGYFGGKPDTVIQRFIEFIMSIPTLPLWLGLSAAVPSSWGPLKVYFAITIILSLVGWTGLARVVRGRFLQLRTEDYVLAAELDGARRGRVIFRHMLPAFTSHIIATLTLAIPGMILAETSLSFLGLGLQAPVVSWGTLLAGAQNLRVVSDAPWLLIPGAAVVITVLALNFVGDGLRDAADPYSS
ncbi:MAG TPA: ABC transporter permease [Mycobacteriales bacterium]|nr:ABC transporter permease [Mycobacteriales bacterium]